MRLVIFTAHYPYGAGEAFLEDEIRTAEKEFDRILIVSGHKRTEKEITRYIPRNAEVISFRADSRDVPRRILALRFLLHPPAVRELLYACRERGWKNIVGNAIQILLTEDSIHCLEKKQAAWLSGQESEVAVYYSYWLGADSLYMVRHRDALRGTCISKTHGGDCFFARGYHPYRTETLQGLDAIFPISAAGREDILRYYASKVPELEKIVILSRLGVKIPEKIPRHAAQNKVRIICTASNVIPLKRLDLLVGALAEIKDTEISWIHFGDGTFLEEIQALAQEKLGSKSNISYEFRGRVANAEILAFYAENPVDLFVNCSDVEGIPVSIMEAMSYGIPTIARNVGGNAEVVDDTCGRLLPKNISKEELAEAIEQMLTLDEVTRHEYADSARSKIVENYHAEKNYSKFYEMVKRMSTDEESSNNI